MTAVVAYNGNRFPAVYAQHLREIRGMGFTGVCHTFSEEDMAFNWRNVRTLCRMTRDEGLEVWIDPWGVGNLFGYGAFSGYLAREPEEVRLRRRNGDYAPYACPNHLGTTGLLFEWLAMVDDFKVDWVLWDEPQFARCYCVRCAAYDYPMLELLRRVTNAARSCNIQNSVCLHGLPLDEPSPMPRAAVVAKLDAVDDIGVSLVPSGYSGFGEGLGPYVRTWCAEIAAAATLTGTRSSAWIPLYSTPLGREHMVGEMATIAREQGISTLCTWSFQGAVATSSCAADDPQAAWAWAPTLVG